MNQLTVSQNKQSPGVKEPVSITEKQMIDKLRRYAIERQIALQKYAGGYSTSQKLEAVFEIISQLDEAYNCLSSKEAVKRILRTTLNFHYIAPSSNIKDFSTWYNKIEECMRSCREFLNWVSQTQH